MSDSSTRACFSGLKADGRVTSLSDAFQEVSVNSKIVSESHL